MKINYERYFQLDSEAYEKTTLISVLIGKECDKIIFNIVSQLKDKNILELGCGTGRYTKMYFQNNNVKCIDINPHLFTLKNVPIIKGNVTQLNQLLSKEERFDCITSFWMTEYLSQKEITTTLSYCNEFLDKNGVVIISFISKGLLGRFYISGAKIKGIKKYCYSKNKIKEIILKTGLELEKSVSVKRMGFELGKIMFLIKPKGF